MWRRRVIVGCCDAILALCPLLIDSAFRWEGGSFQGHSEHKHKLLQDMSANF
jgi:hypothetical protein